MDWIKLRTDMFTDEKILLIEPNDSTLIVWVKLLCMAGKTENDGVFLIGNKKPHTAATIAKVIGRPEKKVREALEELEAFGLIEKVNGVVTIPNWGKHQGSDVIDKSKQAHRERQKRYRERQRSVISDASVTSRVTPGDAVEEEQEEEQEKEVVQVLLQRDALVTLASQEITGMNPVSMEELTSFRDELNDNVIMHGIRMALKDNIHDWRYIRKILNRYVEQGIRTVAEAEADKARWEKSKGSVKAPDKRADLNYQQHGYTESDFGDDFFLNFHERSFSSEDNI